jgi:hypothetical protein
LPEKVADEIYLVFHLDQFQNDILRKLDLWHFAIESNYSETSGRQVNISAENVYWLSESSTYWSHDIVDALAVANPIDLKIETYRGSDEQEIDKTYGRFWLTPNKLISPAQSISSSYTGEVKVKTAWNVDFDLDNGLYLNFTKRYKNRKNENEEQIYWSELVAEYQIEGKAQTFEEVNNSLDELDDFLLISSFALRHRCACIGFDIVNTDGYILDFYRRKLSIPEDKTEEYDELVDVAEIKEFLKTSYKKFIELERNNFVRQAINYAIPREGRTVESEFITLYSALETLVLYFRKQNNFEFVFSESESEPDEWKQFDRILRQLIKKHPFSKYDKTKRERLYDNIPALRRISFRSAYEEFLKFYELDVTDLWSVTNNEEGWSLATIRNKLVHGDYFENRKAVFVAKSHLQWLVERLLLKILDWDISKSNVCPNQLSAMSEYNNWHTSRKSLFK